MASENPSSSQETSSPSNPDKETAIPNGSASQVDESKSSEKDPSSSTTSSSQKQTTPETKTATSDDGVKEENKPSASSTTEVSSATPGSAAAAIESSTATTTTEKKSDEVKSNEAAAAAASSAATTTTTTTDGGAAAAAPLTTTIPPVDPFYADKLPNRVIIPGSRPAALKYYVERARRILRNDETCTVTGVGRANAMACTLVEILKRQKIAVVSKISTKMNVQPTFSNRRSGSGVDWGRPFPMIVFTLSRGEHAEYVTDFRQRKVIEIFEQNDPNHTGLLSLEKCKELNLGKAFHAKSDQIGKAELFLEKMGGDSINLPNFIRYASILIHPLLKNKAFRDALILNFGTGGDESNLSHHHDDDNGVAED